MNNDLSCIDLIFPDLLLEEPMLTNLFPIEASQLVPPPQDLKMITDRLEDLEIASNTQSLRIEVERMKRQKLRASLRQLKHHTPSP